MRSFYVQRNNHLICLTFLAEETKSRRSRVSMTKSSTFGKKGTTILANFLVVRSAKHVHCLLKHRFLTSHSKGPLFIIFLHLECKFIERDEDKDREDCYCRVVCIGEVWFMDKAEDEVNKPAKNKKRPIFSKKD